MSALALQNWPIAKIVVCATQRCGSTMVCQDLTGVGIFGTTKEWFVPWIRKPDADWSRAAEEVLRERTGPNGVFSIKIMANQLRQIERRLAAFSTPGSGDEAFPSIMALLPAPTTWIWLRRRDTVAQAISRHVARSSKVYHARRADADAAPRRAVHETRLAESIAGVQYDFKSILRAYQEIMRETLLWQMFFERNALQPLLWYYEDLQSGSGTYLAELAALIGLPGDLEQPARNLVRLAGDKSAEFRRQFARDLTGIEHGPEKLS